MGVPLLLTWLRRRFTSCFLPATGQVSQHVRNPDNLYVDLNSLLYQSAQIMTSSGSSFRHAEELENAILQKLFDLLDDLIFEVCGEPQRLVYLAVDGVSPLGKLSQQRARRSRARRTRRHYGARSSGPDIESMWDSNCISVGTRFMEKVTEALHHYAVTRTERVNSRRFAAVQEKLRASAQDETSTQTTELVPIAIVVDDVLRPGEGENKITEAIRRFRSHPDYNPNTSHIICSSDTDVTVSSLILHEPRIHVLRYEPSSMVAARARHNQYNNNNHHNNNGSHQQQQQQQQGGGPMADTWNSTFFSINQFRHELREVLGLQHLPVEPGSVVGVQYNEEKDTQLEKTLHDVVFVMLLFGNDFLPECGGSIQEGTLDGLLTILANDFVSRGRTIVNPETNQILFESARFLLDCLHDIRGDRRRGGGGGPSHFAGSGDVISVNSSGGGDPAMQWGFEDDEAFQEKQAKKEKQLEMKCYCYWTMLQWALQYSAGIVEHWGCYYPFSDAPPLQALQKYCGVLTYEALMSFALNFRHANAAAAAAATSPALAVPSTKTYDNAPPDVLVQLLILLPSRSVALLPSAIRPAFAEVEPLVQAPMEKLDFVAIRNWCQQKRSHLTEVERTRFLAYEVFAHATCLSECTEKKTGQRIRFAASDLVFAALWNREKVQEELNVMHRRLVEEAKKASAPSATAPQPSVLMTSGKGASFFGAKKAGGASSAAAAAAALLQNAKTAPPLPPVTTRTDPTPPETLTETTASAAVATVPQCEKCVETSFNINLAPLSILPSVQLARSLGYIDGARFTMVVASTSTDGTDPSHFLSSIDPMGGKRDLSRDTLTQQVRLQWLLACVPIECSPEVVRLNAARLLPGYKEPNHEQTFKEAVDAGRASLLDATMATGDVWKNAKRARESDSSSSEDTDDKETTKRTEAVPVVAEAVSKNNDSNHPSSAADDLERKREEMRKRLAALKQGLDKS